MLTPSAVTNAKPRPEAYKLTDGRGMYLLVKPDGARWWRFDYRRPGTGKRNTLSLGTFPDTSLKRAREKRDDWRRLIADGVDPGEKRKAERVAAADTFEAVAREWHAKFAAARTEGHAKRILRRFEVDVFPWIGAQPVGKLTAPGILSVLRRIESRGAIETAHRTRSDCGMVMRFAVATGRAQADVTRDLHGALAVPTPKHHAAITDPNRIGELMRAIEGFTGTFPVRCALKLASLTFVRPGELRQAEWAEFDLDKAEWSIPAERMKMRRPHLVPLSSQATMLLRELWPLTGSGRYVFPGARDRKRPMSNVTINAALRRMGFDRDTMTGHGFRAMARTVLDEGLGFRPDYIEHQLAHAVREPDGRAYNRTAHLPERIKMMQAWADHLDTLRMGTNVVPIKRKAS
ncbi:tyrosine-type recombinase/integrase [Dokdonella fugitiva]|uniref:tyrosine-type recombinase/integrase n=1 Tax=Dokdonella fugitiva TaxID=328517 RepID=UPI0015FC97FE|nr:integrase arm-type DNA-binding domain-containing protein [Dokdonella fugitiva]MBA8884916.1 integrase [Dokdonella fugitiva]